MRPIEVGGLTPLSTTDWPDHLAAVVFVQGCPWRCHYCHNRSLQPRGAGTGPTWPELLPWLARRSGLIDGVVFSGGEPTLDRALESAVAQVRALGLEVALHTAGIFPERLRALLPSLSWVGLDLKTGFAGYDDLTQSRGSAARVQRSLDALLESGVAHEIRTTYHPALIDDEALLDTARRLGALGVPHWVLQRWRAPEGDAESSLPPWRWPDADLLDALRAQGPALSLR
ncbi:MAG: anaerobic ribonucleoside-triphosphate reductase activating protein [Burkholderiales bacterium]|nr:anaerobic ribonucleoside-triphosphate reductase activating protein [Burkholderiales bacterium]MDE2395796.1 anaerobic ribonucleoside-triphosphate reductase activating protein [Burkholderiales bacterium]MDE2453913.1 anaerobic ribonucleoside-triphosphate reductase activating protein [Burkholderiales bacterium]